MVATPRMTLALAITLLLLVLINCATAEGGQRSDTARRLNANLAGTPLAGTGWIMEAEGHRHGIHPAFIAAAAGIESAWGRLPCRSNPRNVWGLGSCDRAWQVPHFTTWRYAIRYYARFIRSRWPHARTPYDLHGYCECGSRSWGSRVAWNMDRLGFPAVVRYGRR